MTIDLQFVNYLDNQVNQPQLFLIYYTMLYLILIQILPLLANKSSTARDILSRLQLAYENLPKWLQQGVINWNKGNIELENKSTIVAPLHHQVLFEVVLIILYF